VQAFQYFATHPEIGLVSYFNTETGATQDWQVFGGSFGTATFKGPTSGVTYNVYTEYLNGLQYVQAATGLPPAGPLGVSSLNQQSGKGSISGGAIAGIVIALLVVLAIVAVVVFLVYRRRQSSPKIQQQKTMEVIIQKSETSSQILRTSQAEVAKPEEVPKKPLPVAPGMAVGTTVMAKYSGDGKEYKGVIQEVKPGSFLIKYVDFGEDKEWGMAAKIKKK